MPLFPPASSGGLTVGTTTITGGSNTSIEYNNSGVLGEYTVSGTGTTVPLTVSPAFTGTVTAAAQTNSGVFTLSGAGTAAAPRLVFSGANTNTGFYAPAAGQVGFSVAGTNVLDYSISNGNQWSMYGGNITYAGGGGGFITTQSYVANSTGQFTWSSGGTLTSPAAAKVQLGSANAASPVAQTLLTQGSRGGTDSNVGGGALTIQSGLGTGTGTLSTLILQSPKAAASGTTQQTAVTGLTVNVGTAVLTNYTVANLPSAATAGAGATAFVTDASTTLVLGLGGTVAGGGANKAPVYSDGTNWLYG